MPTVAAPMSSIAATSAALRPSRSPTCPKTIPPTGRAANPTNQVEKASRVPVKGSDSGKNSRGNTRAATMP